MKIETKYNIGDVVWILENNKAREVEIDRIAIHALKNGTINVRYEFIIQRDDYRDCFDRKEENIFLTKEELLASL